MTATGAEELDVDGLAGPSERSGASPLRFFHLLLAEAGRTRIELIASIAIAGTAMAGLMAIVNTVADRRTTDGVNFELLVVFVLAAVVVITGQTYALRLTTKLSEGMLERLRVRVARLVRRTELDALEGIGVVRIYDTIARETTTLSEASGMIVHGATALVALVLACFYIAALSMLAFTVVAVLMVATTIAYRYSQRNSRESLNQAAEVESRFFELMSHLLQGFKEVKLSSARGDDLETNHLAAISALTEQRKIEASDRINTGLTISYASFYTLLAACVFALPQYLDSPETAMKIIYVAIFLLSGVELVTKALPLLAKAGLAIDRLDALEDRLTRAAADQRVEGVPAPTAFERIEAHGVVYTHYGPDGRPAFTLGPCTFAIEPGELVFVVGGNGSGKSTLLRTLTRLYEPHAGSITWDGHLVDAGNAAEYRNMFSAVYADFHLFDRLYGMEGADPERVDALLRDIGLGDKTTFQDGRFSNLDLSTGQRKRLAFVVALLEDRPIYVLDELAADQDPQFRQRFYSELLDDLRARGKAVIVVSHDERYFHLGDRVYSMEDGRFVVDEGTS